MKRQNTRERILVTCRKLFNTSGVAAVTTAAIAEAVGINEGNLYYYFKKKADIVSELFEQFAAEQLRVASQQDVEERRTQLTVDDANVHAAEAAVSNAKANVNRLIELKAFSHVTAPFAGRIVARNVELGQLVNAGSAGGPGLFTLAQVDPLRVFVHVPQDFATSVKAGQKVSVAVREFPGRDFPGTVTRTAGALDAASRTLLVEVQLPSQGTLLAGMYAQVTLDLSEPRPVLRLPATALQLGAHGPRVALVDEKHKLHFQPVQVGEDHGTEVEIVNGLSVEDQVVLFVPAGVSDDTQVEVMEPKRT